MIVSVDPGLRGCGVALFTDAGRLWRAGYPQNRFRTERGPEAWAGMAAAVESFVTELTAGAAITVVLIEGQAINFDRTRNPADILECNGVAGAVAGAYCTCPRVVGYRRPEDWKGTIKKEDMTARIERRMAERGETGAVPDSVPSSLRHNVLDAVGIGYHYFGVLQARKVYPR